MDFNDSKKKVSVLISSNKTLLRKTSKAPKSQMHQQGQMNTPAMTGLGRVPAPTGNFVSSVGSESSVCQDASTRVENQKQKDCTKKEHFQCGLRRL